MHLPRFLPLQRFPSHEELLTSDGIQTTGYVAPPGFHTLSTPCSPHDLPGLFHPGTAHGVNPSRSYSLPGAVRSFERRFPLEVSLRPEDPWPFSRAWHTRQVTPRSNGVTREPCEYPLGLGPLRGLQPRFAKRPCHHVCFGPSRAFPCGSRMTNTVAPQGSLTRGTRPFSLEIDQPP